MSPEIEAYLYIINDVFEITNEKPRHSELDLLLNQYRKFIEEKNKLENDIKEILENNSPGRKELLESIEHYKEIYENNYYTGIDADGYLAKYLSLKFHEQLNKAEQLTYQKDHILDHKNELDISHILEELAFKLQMQYYKKGKKDES